MSEGVDRGGVTAEEFAAFFSRLSWVQGRAVSIANAKQGGGCEFEGFDSEGRVRYSYWDGCNCHGSNCYDTFPSELLFDEDAEKDILAANESQKAWEAEKKLQVAAADKLRKEEADRKEFERLKAKFDSSLEQSEKEA